MTDDASESDLLKTITEAISDAINVSYGSSGVELQIIAINRLTDVYETLAKAKAQFISQQDEKRANAAYIWARFLCGTQNFLRIWVELKNDDAGSAWLALVAAQSEIALGLRHAECEEMYTLARRLLFIEQTVFPPQQFVSVSHVYKKVLCSICDGPYGEGECNHVEGKLYMGQVCELGLRELVKINHVARVAHPADKACRLETRWDEVRAVDTLTNRIEPKPSNAEEVANGGRARLLRLSTKGEMYKYNAPESPIEPPMK